MTREEDEIETVVEALLRVADRRGWKPDGRTVDLWRWVLVALFDHAMVVYVERLTRVEEGPGMSIRTVPLDGLDTKCAVCGDPALTEWPGRLCATHKAEFSAYLDERGA